MNSGVATSVSRAKTTKMSPMTRSKEAIRKKISTGATPGHHHLRQELAVEDLEPLHPLAQRHQHVAGALLVEVSGTQVEGVPVELVVQPFLHPGGGLLAHHVPQILEQRAQRDEAGDGRQVGDKRREGSAGEDPGDDQPGEGQPRDAGGHRAQAEHGGRGDAPAHAAGMGQQSSVQVHNVTNPSLRTLEVDRDEYKAGGAGDRWTGSPWPQGPLFLGKRKN